MKIKLAIAILKAGRSYDEASRVTGISINTLIELFPFN